jgi:hypothetical protein
MVLKELYEEYGKLGFQFENIQARLAELRRKIMEELRKEKPSA